MKACGFSLSGMVAVAAERRDGRSILASAKLQKVKDASIREPLAVCLGRAGWLLTVNRFTSKVVFWTVAIIRRWPWSLKSRLSCDAQLLFSSGSTRLC
jgi:hypothetical protein